LEDLARAQPAKTNLKIVTRNADYPQSMDRSMSSSTTLSSRAVIALGSLLALAHIAVIAAIGPSWRGVLLSNIIQLALGILGVFVTLQTSRRCARLGRHFWRLASISCALWTAAQAIGTYSDSFQPDFAVWLTNFLFASWYMPIGLTLLLSEESDSPRFDWLQAIDLSQAVLFWIAAYAYFFHIPSHVGEVSPPLGIPYFVCYGMIIAAFFLRSLISTSKVARALFRRAGIFLLLSGGFDALFEYGPGKSLPTGAWFDLLWSMLMFISLLAAALWTDEDAHRPFEPSAISVNRRVGTQLFSFLYPVLTLCMAVPIVRSYIAMASAVVLTSLACSGIRLLITQHRLMETEEALRQDIGRRERAEEAHRQIEERFAKAFRSNPEGIVISTKDDGRIIEANDAYVRMMGYERSELIGHTVKELNVWAPGEREQVVNKLQECGVIRDYDMKFQSKGGRIKEGQISVEEIQIREVPCLLVSIRDVTERRLMERQLRAAQKMEAIGQLAGGVAHDFNNVLMIISGSVQLMQSSTGHDPNSTARYLAQIESATEKASSLTRQLLAFSRQQVLRPTILDLNLIVTDLWKLLPRLLGEDVESVLHLASDLGSVNADRGQLEQVIMNLAVNARDAMPGGGKLILETANVELDSTSAIRHGAEIPPGHYVVLAVTDNGQGMDATTQARLFEPFFTTKELGKGTGLGLATVYGIVKQSAGYVWVYSEVGKGTAFKVYLPRVPGKMGVRPVSISEPVAGGSETILLVEDEGGLRSLASDYLEYKGYRVLSAADGQDALRVCQDFDGPIHLMLTDVVMPGGGGPDLAKTVLQTRPDVRVIYMSGYTDRVLSEKLGENASFLQKPFSLDHLASKIRSLLNCSNSTLA
jgi:two-component system cell cycle sensor histidine kinase/response regulator CckA